jgi:hypothetical protein
VPGARTSENTLDFQTTRAKHAYFAQNGVDIEGIYCEHMIFSIPAAIMIIYHIMSGKQKRFVHYSHNSLSLRNGLTMTLYISVFLAHTSSTRQSLVRTSAMEEEHRDHHHESINSDQQDEHQQQVYIVQCLLTT